MTTDDLRARVLAAATAARASGTPVHPPAPISGAEVLRREIAHLDRLLYELAPAEWATPALRDLDVHGLVGHLVAVEHAFADALEHGRDTLGADGHLSAIHPTAATHPPTETHRAWFDATTATLAGVEHRDPTQPVSFYGVTLPLDDLLVVRSFEMWVHDEDIRRATGRPLDPIEPASLARMTRLVATLLPAHAVRLVLTGPGGGTWDLGDGPRTRIVVDATEFCRVAGNRADARGTGAIVDGDAGTATSLFAAAGALALD